MEVALTFVEFERCMSNCLKSHYEQMRADKYGWTEISLYFEWRSSEQFEFLKSNLSVLSANPKKMVPRRSAIPPSFSGDIFDDAMSSFFRNTDSRTGAGRLFTPSPGVQIFSLWGGPPPSLLLSGSARFQSVIHAHRGDGKTADQIKVPDPFIVKSSGYPICLPVAIWHFQSTVSDPEQDIAERVPGGPLAEIPWGRPNWKKSPVLRAILFQNPRNAENGRFGQFWGSPIFGILRREFSTSWGC